GGGRRVGRRVEVAVHAWRQVASVVAGGLGSERAVGQRKDRHDLRGVAGGEGARKPAGCREVSGIDGAARTAARRAVLVDVAQDGQRRQGLDRRGGGGDGLQGGGGGGGGVGKSGSPRGGRGAGPRGLCPRPRASRAR